MDTIEGETAVVADGRLNDAFLRSEGRASSCERLDRLRDVALDTELSRLLPRLAVAVIA